MTYLPYSRSLEQIAPDEAATFAGIAETFTRMGEQVAGQEGRALRVSHAKPTALLTGTLTVQEGLPAELAQGIAAAPRQYETLIRFAQGPGELLDDRISTHRGMAVKLLGVPGERIAEAGDADVQDFVLEAHSKAFINADATRFLANLRAGVSRAPSMSEGMKSTVSRTARAAEAALEAVGLESKTLGFFGHPPLHPLAEAYFSQVPMRWGGYVAKVGFYPTGQTCAALGELEVDNGDDPIAFRNAMVDHFAQAGAAFELRVQLAIDPESTPIEDAAVEWPEDASPYRTVAMLEIPPQTAWSEARDAFFTPLSFRPAHSLAAHRPLGQIMRARLFVYERLVAFRRSRNGEQPAEPRSIHEVPAG